MAYSTHYKDNTVDNDMMHPYYQKLTHKEKFDDDAKWIADSVQHIDRYSGYSNRAYQDRLHINYAIAKGRGKEAIQEAARNKRNLTGIDKKLLDTKYYDILSPIFKAMSGEQQKRQLQAIAKDISGYTQNMYKNTKLEYYQDWTNSNILQPIKERVTQEVFTEFNITNPQDLKPEEQEEINANIQERLKFRTPEDIDSFMNNKFRSPSETMIQEMLDWYIMHFDIKFKTDESFKHLLLSGIEVARQTIDSNNRIICDILNPKGFTYYAKDNTFFIDEGEWWKYEEDISYIDLVSSIPADSTLLKELHDVASKYGISSKDYARRTMRGEAPEGVNEILSEFINAGNGGPFTDTAYNDLGSPEGQGFLAYMYRTYGASGNTGTSQLIRKANICYKSFDPVFLVERYNNKLDKLDQFWVGENYEKNPELDRRVTPYWAPAYYSADKLGAESSFIYNKQRIPFQNRSVNNPFDIVSPYTGVEYSRLFNNAKPVAPIDFGKPSQYEYNHVKKKMEEADKRDVGRVFAVPESFIPQDWDYERFVGFIKETGIVPINENNSSLNPAISAQILKSIDITTNDYQAAYQNRLEYIKREAETNMSYSPSQLGQAPPSLTATSNQQNIIQGSYKTEDIFSLHAMFVNKLLSNGMVMLKNALLTDDDLRKALLSIPSLAALEVDDKMLFESTPFIKVLNTTDEVAAVKDVVNLLQPMIQNGVIKNISEVIKMRFKKNSAELLNVAEEAERKVEAQMQAERKTQLEESEKNRQMQIQINKDNLASEKEKWMYQEETKRYIADKDYEKWVRQTDVDQNQVPDSVQVAMVKANIDNESQDKQRDLERDKIKSNEKIANSNNKSRERIANKKESKKSP